MIRQTTDRVAMVGSSFGGDREGVLPRAARERARGVLNVVLDLEVVEPRAAGLELDPEHEVVTAEDLVAKVDRRRFRPDLRCMPDRGEGPAVVGRERDRHAVGLGLANGLELDPAAEVDVRGRERDDGDPGLVGSGGVKGRRDRRRGCRRRRTRGEVVRGEVGGVAVNAVADDAAAVAGEELLEVGEVFLGARAVRYSQFGSRSLSTWRPRLPASRVSDSPGRS